jgi:dTDP-4-amino-4,6-dideoxygalactose transaminase
LALRCQLIRNHAEAVVDGLEYKGNPVNMVGMNLRMTEVEAAIGRIQLGRLDGFLEARLRNIDQLEKGLGSIPFLTMPKRRPDSRHAFYVHPMRFNATIAGVSRDAFVKAVNAELLPGGGNTGRNSMVSCGYVKPLYLQSLYQKQTGIGEARHPFKNPVYGKVDYPVGLCPVAERMHFQEVVISDLIHASLSPSDMDDVIAAFRKVADNRSELK